MTEDQLMSEVTAAVLKAEQALKDTITAFEALQKAEQAILDANTPGVSTLDKRIAFRGAHSCQRTLLTLNGLWESKGTW
jgi:hypothetical protein